MSPGRRSRGAPSRRRFHLRRPTWRGWFTLGLIVAVATVVTLWAIDYGTLGDRVARNVTVENVDLGRRSGPSLQAALTRADRVYGKGTVIFVIDGEPHPMSAAEIGLHLDTDATTAAAERVGRDDPPVLRPVLWAASFFRHRHAPVTVTLDRAKLADALATLPGQTPVVEPSVVGSIEAIGTSPGERGYGFDPDSVATQIEREARDGTLPLRIPLAAGIIEPSVTDGQVALLAAHARTLTDRTIELSIPGANMVATPPLLRSWISSQVSGSPRRVGLVMNPVAVVRDVRDEMGTIITDPVDATFTVEDSEAYLVPQVNGLRCCAVSSGVEILAALEADEASVDLPLSEVEPEFTTADARKLGITTRLATGRSSDDQRIWSPTRRPEPGDTSDSVDDATAPSSSTTTSTTTTTTVPPDPAARGQFIVPIPNRSGQVHNVDAAVPKVTGRIIMPGGQFSLNDAIGPPSPGHGFVPADVETDEGPTWISGGGTDLVAAALFRAAYEAGLDIPVSTRHRVLPAGVPAGVEATLGWSAPDLVVANPSDHAILIWVDRVGGGVRVQLFGTPFTRSVDTARRELPFGPDDACLAVDIRRTRVFLDGAGDAVDDFDAVYTPPPEARDDPDRITCQE